MTPTGDIIVGLAFVICCTAALVPYGFCLRAITGSKDLMKNSCYKFMVQLGVADMVQLFVLATGGCMSIFQTTFHPWFNIIMGGIMGIGFFATVLFCNLIAFNRLISTAGKRFMERLFGEKELKLWSIAVWFVAVFFGVWSWATKSFVYSLWSFSWYYDIALPENTTSLWLLKQSATWTANSCIILILVWYALMLIAQRMFVSAVDTSSNLAKMERIATLTALLICSALVTEQLVFLLGPMYLPPDNRYAYLVLSFAWIVNTGINPAIYLTLNRSIRNRVKHMVRKSNQVSIITLPLSRMTARNTGKATRDQ